MEPGDVAGSDAGATRQWVRIGRSGWKLTVHLLIKSAETEAMTAPRARGQDCPPSPPDRLPPRRGGRPSSQTVSAAGRPAALARLAGARRGLLRSARALAAAALLALVGALALPATAYAQIVTTLVSNTSKDHRGFLVALDLDTQPHAQRFTTGSNTEGYHLSSVDVISVTGDPSAAPFPVQVCPVSGNAPTSLCTFLRAPSSVVAGTKSFHRPGNNLPRTRQDLQPLDGAVS